MQLGSKGRGYSSPLSEIWRESVLAQPWNSIFPVKICIYTTISQKHVRWRRVLTIRRDTVSSKESTLPTKINIRPQHITGNNEIVPMFIDSLTQDRRVDRQAKALYPIPKCPKINLPARSTQEKEKPTLLS